MNIQHTFVGQMIIASWGKGYYINDSQIAHRPKIFLLFNKLSAHKKLIYDALAQELDANASSDFFIYNTDFRLFKKIITEHAHGYTHYVIISHFIDGGE